MSRWDKVLPLEIKDVQYEELVTKPQSILDDILDFDLPWCSECLDFFNSERHVVAASGEQVRRPIYGSSICRWKHYEAHLDSLKKALSS